MFISKGCEILAVTLYAGVYLSELLDFSGDIVDWCLLVEDVRVNGGIVEWCILGEDVRINGDIVDWRLLGEDVS